MLRSKLISLMTVLMTASGAAAGTITAETSDGVTIHGETYFGDLPDNAPLVLLFHQGGSNGRGEYGDTIAPWLNENGFRAIAWDQRSGGDGLGSNNRTVAGLSQGTAAGFCDVYPDLDAALKTVQSEFGAEKVIVWGSSYSAALVFQLAAKHADIVAGVAAFSPASGGPLANCRGRDYLDDVKAKVLLMRPQSEMGRESTEQQMAIFKEWGADSAVIEHGVHGSSMLVDERTGNDMADARSTVLAWLQDTAR